MARRSFAVASSVGSFINGWFTLRGAANRLSGEFHATESGTITFDSIMTTAKLGPGIGLDIEVSDALDNARHFEVHDRRLRISHGINSELEFYPDDADTSGN